MTDKPDARKSQVGGDHYKNLKIQPAEFITANGLGFLEGCVIKRMARWRNKDGVADLEKARHEIDLLIAYHREDTLQNTVTDHFAVRPRAPVVHGSVKPTPTPLSDSIGVRQKDHDLSVVESICESLERAERIRESMKRAERIRESMERADRSGGGD